MFKNRKQHLEEDITIYDENDSIARSRQKSRRVFVFYIIALFSVALVIILASYVVQAHQREQLENMDKQLNEQFDITAGAESRAAKMQKQIQKMEKKMDRLQEQLDQAQADLKDYKKQLEDSEKQLEQSEIEVKALNQLWKLEEYYENGEYDEAEELIDQMDEEYSRAKLTNSDKSPLTGDAATEYHDICTALGV